MKRRDLLAKIDSALDVSFRAKGAVMLTRDGNIINPLDPDPITVEEVAHVLSRFCRYGGHCPQHYSVAQHSVMVSLLVEQAGDLPRLALLHDAHEAYFGDWPKPVKNAVPGLGIVEADVEAKVRVALNMPLDLPGVVKKADLQALSIEMKWLWAGRLPVSARERKALLHVRDWTMDEARDGFLARFAAVRHTEPDRAGMKA